MTRVLAALLTAALALPAPGAAPAPRRTVRRTAPRPTPPPRTAAPAGDRISLDLKDADIRDVLRTFATLQHFNLVIDPEVKGSVTVRLVDVRWEQGLDVILRSNGLSCEVEGTIVRIGTIR